jgi:hypothetical protein
MKVRTVLPAVAAVLAFGATPSLASAPQGQTLRSDTPNSCIALNQGDWNACNVGNSGRGDLPYKPVAQHPENSERMHQDQPWRLECLQRRQQRTRRPAVQAPIEMMIA